MNAGNTPAGRRAAARPQGRGLVASAIDARRSHAFYVERAQSRRVPDFVLYGPPGAPCSVREELWRRHLFIGNACYQYVAAVHSALRTQESRALQLLVAEVKTGGPRRMALTASLSQIRDDLQIQNAMDAEIRSRLPTVNERPCW